VGLAFRQEKAMNTILVIDDCLTDLQVISGSLEKAGFTVFRATNEQEAKTKISQQRPDLIVLDVVLPDRSGFEFCRDLKEENSTQNIPVIMCSSKTSKMDKYWGLQQGADAYMGKPVDGEELIQTISKLV
jgi:two-component system, chemotaxis family, response regulator PixH